MASTNHKRLLKLNRILERASVAALDMGHRDTERAKALRLRARRISAVRDFYRR